WITDNGEWFDYNNSEFGANSSEKTRHFFKNDFRYNANLFTNLLTGESQTTIVGNANNTNEIRSGRGRGFWGGSNSGITRTENIGVNTNIDASKKVDGLLIGSDAQFTHSHNNTQTKQDKTTYGDDVVYDNTDSISKITKSWDAKVRLEFEWTIDTLNTVFFKPTISYTNNESNGYNEYIYYRDTTEIINDGNQSTYSLSEDISAELNVIYNRKLQKKGRVLTLNGSFSFTNTKGNSSTLSYDNLLKKTLIDQYPHSGNDALSYSLKVSYMEPLSKDCRHLMEMNATYRANHRDSHKDQFSKNELNGDYEYDSTYSNALKNNFYSEIAELNYRFLSEHSDLTVGASINPSQTRSTSYYGSILARDTLLSVVNWSPNVSFRYKFGKKEFARVIYRGNSTQPTITQLEPVRNNSNAMSETVGTLGLQPAFTHRFRFFYSRYNEKRFSNLMTGIRANLTQDALVNNTIYDQRGKVYSQTVNAKTIPWNIGMHLMYNTPFAKKLFQFHTRTSANYRSQVGYVLREQQTTVIEQMIEKNQLVLGNKSFTNNLTANENIMLRFTHDIVDIGVRGDFTYSYTTNTFSSTKSNVYSWSVTGYLQFHLPKSWNINADCGYSDKIGYGSDLGNMSEIMLNASIEKSWGAATLSIKAFDILNQRKNVVQVVGADYIKYEKYNTLPTYGMITFSYKINRMGSLKATGRAAFMQEMIDNKGGMPSGPPPMHR
ncbi:MAG: outer membrane beta-barrel protein, partial [Paludibacteraceae bacterium]|nr:outer membrane beta-barrel protein [Paludibacteraceae bacterium]